MPGGVLVVAVRRCVAWPEAVLVEVQLSGPHEPVAVVVQVVAKLRVALEHGGLRVVAISGAGGDPVAVQVGVRRLGVAVVVDTQVAEFGRAGVDRGRAVVAIALADREPVAVGVSIRTGSTGGEQDKEGQRSHVWWDRSRGRTGALADTPPVRRVHSSR